MKKWLLLIPISLIVIGAFGALSQSKVDQTSTDQNVIINGSQITERLFAQNLDTPWGMAFLPDGALLVTERKGTIRYIGSDGKLRPAPLATIANAKEAGEGGLLGIAVHPNFPEKPYLYVYYTYTSEGDNTLNRLSRFTYQNDAVEKEEILIDAIPGARFHNGGVVRFGPDGNLYIGTGDAQEPSKAQNTNNLAGKILRVTDGGQPVSGNPFRNEVYSYGHRNVQGLAWDEDGNLYATEHGRSGVQSGLDELNTIVMGKNYGWPEIQGNEVKPGMLAPAQNSGNTTWAPAGLAYLDGVLYFGGLRGQSLYTSQIKDGKLEEVLPLFEKKYGRIRAVIAGPENSLYFSTSNHDGRGTPKEGDDKIMKITFPSAP